MKKQLEGSMEENRFTLLNDLYNDYSIRVHHTVSVPTDYINLTMRLENKNKKLDSFVDTLKKIETIFLEEIFLVLSPDSENENTSYKMRVKNNTSDHIIKRLNLA